MKIGRSQWREPGLSRGREKRQKADKTAGFRGQDPVWAPEEEDRQPGAKEFSRDKIGMV